MDDLRLARPRFFRSIKDVPDLTVRMPEGLFDDLLEKKAYDLLGLEEMLAHSVDAIVIFPESPGSFAELGAFSGNEALRKKTICVCEAKYKNQLSFINVGPIKILKNVKRSRVMYCKYKDLSISSESQLVAARIATQVRSIKREYPAAESGLFLLEDLVKLALFCMDGASAEEIKQLYTAEDIGIDRSKLDKLYDICLHTLQTSHKIERNEVGRYFLNDRTVREITAKSNKDRLEMLRKIRVEVMNSSLRRQASVTASRMV